MDTIQNEFKEELTRAIETLMKTPDPLVGETMEPAATAMADVLGAFANVMAHAYRGPVMGHSAAESSLADQQLAEWYEKTSWIQEEYNQGLLEWTAVGRHRADVIRQLVIELRRKIAIRSMPWSTVASPNTITLNYDFASAILGALYYSNPTGTCKVAHEEIKQNFAAIMRGEVSAQSREPGQTTGEDHELQLR